MVSNESFEDVSQWKSRLSDQRRHLPVFLFAGSEATFFRSASVTLVHGRSDLLFFQIFQVSGHNGVIESVCVDAFPSDVSLHFHFQQLDFFYFWWVGILHCAIIMIG